MKAVVLIPAYKPEDKMTALLSELSGRGFDIVVVDDGSGEGYSRIFKQARGFATVLSYESNRGKGEALKHGIAYIDKSFEKPYVIVTADADCQHRPEDIAKVCDTAQKHPDSLVLGKRTLSKTSPLLSRLGNGTTRFFYHLSTGRYIYETQTGLRGFSDRLARIYLRLPGKRYEFESDMMLISSDFDIIEVDIETVYFDNNSNSHFDPIRDTHRLHREYARYKLPSLIAAAFDYLLFAAAMLFLPWGVLLSQLCARTLSFIIKAVLHKAIFFSENLRPLRYIITCLLILTTETAMLLCLCKAGMDPYIAKLLSGFSMIFLSIGVRKAVCRFFR